VEAEAVTGGGEGIERRGFFTLEEVYALPGCPSRDEHEGRRLAVVECGHPIPCNPCETGCKAGALTVGTPITNLPVLDASLCDGCGTCMIDCPGLAIFVVDLGRDDGLAEVWLPHEFLPLPAVGGEVVVRDRSGRAVGEGRVTKVRTARRLNRTAVVHVLVEKHLAMQVRALEVPS
jgi:Fe-S-cluster-containing hydrogenase component 2